MLEAFNFAIHEIPTPMALAAVALIGYLFGQRTRRAATPPAGETSRDVLRANQVAKELERIAESVRKDLALHRASVNRFKERVGQLTDHYDEAAWHELCREAEDVLKPTLKLALQISLAYDGIRRQSTQLMTLTENRTDLLTGVNNRRVLDETLDNMFALMPRLANSFSIAIFDIDHFQQINDHDGHQQGDRTLQRFAALLDQNVRETDVVARYGGEEFVVIMPDTHLRGAGIFAERLRKMVAAQLPLTISAGLATAVEQDTSAALLSRADSALYSAKAAGRNRVFQHDGQEIEGVSLPESEHTDSAPVDGWKSCQVDLEATAGHTKNADCADLEIEQGRSTSPAV